MKENGSNTTPDTDATKNIHPNFVEESFEGCGMRRKFVTISQLTLPIPGRTEKLLLVEDVTTKCQTTEIMEQRAEFGSFTEDIMI